MIYHITGTLDHTEPNLAVVDAQGVGWACLTSLNSLASMKKGDRVKLYTHMYLREDLCDLYGFATQSELATFRMLITISGVGPKAALSILSSSSPERLAMSIITGDEKALTAAPGIGKKLAQRIILELKDKLSKQQGGGTFDSVGVSFDMPSDAGKLGEAQGALGVLGYSPADAASALRGLDVENLELEEIIRQALRKLARL